MGFFDALRRVLTHETHAQVPDDSRKKIRHAWGLDAEPGPMKEGPETNADVPPAETASAYDRSQWEKKLRKILEDLPGSQSSWNDLMTEAHALELDQAWIDERQREGFAFLIRKAVSDRVVSEDDHRKLDLARKLIGLPEAEAEQTLHTIIAEAEAIFGSPVRDEV
jgi:hypothetical protein